MSDPRNDVLAPFQASIRSHLGEIADAWMGAKLKLIQKLGDQIAGENDQAKLKELRKELSDALISAEDVSQVDAQIGAMLSAMKKHVATHIEIKKMYAAAAKELGHH